MFRSLVKQILRKGEGERAVDDSVPHSVAHQDTSRKTSDIERIIGRRLLKIAALQRRYRRHQKVGMASGRQASASPSVGPDEQEGGWGKQITELDTQQYIVIGTCAASECYGTRLYGTEASYFVTWSCNWWRRIQAVSRC